MLTRTKLLIVTAAMLASVSAVSASEPIESSITGRYASITTVRGLDAYAQDRSAMRGFVLDHAKGAVPN